MAGQAITSDDLVMPQECIRNQQGVQQLFVYLPDESVSPQRKRMQNNLLTAPAHTTVDSFVLTTALWRSGIALSEGYSFRDSARLAVACAAISRASGSLNNPTLSADNALSLVPMV